MQYPANYGFIPKTLSGDNDPCDVWVFCSEPLKELSMIRCFPIGVVDMIDSGLQDEKIIAVPFEDPLYKNFNFRSQKFAISSQKAIPFFRSFSPAIAPLQPLQFSSILSLLFLLKTCKTPVFW